MNKITLSVLASSLVACGLNPQAEQIQESGLTALSAQPISVLPLSDPNNESQWIYNTEVSDEFESASLDEDRWYIVGKFEDGKPVYKHPDKPNKKVWKGRAPSQFSGRNYRLEDGKLILETRWEPDFPFYGEIHKPVFGDALPYENLTTACIIGRRDFKYGYIEIKSKAADAEVSSAFWSMGKKLEVDFFELFGDHRGENKDHIDRQLWWSIRDWSKAVKGKPTYTEYKDLGFRVADDFHVYGIEWDEDGFKYYIDGKLLSDVPAAKVDAFAKEHRGVDKGYVATKPLNLWLDQETFPWHGVPDSLEDLEKNSPEGKKEDGIVDFEIEYVRVWQKKPNIKAGAY
ncbi:family 16 glycosylhydrolase [Algibacillus agarilyticus]|uniref:family 16 glycosylhydrolase n=1 Tax=Algibacillus agarilyticus TaxID=2234133 RepID=UPI001E498B89|nr:family 16 glycosylhydrolase [Algibacillus agarilyticus]